MIHPKLIWGSVCIGAQLVLAPMAAAQATPAAAVSESDYLQDVPTVISVSRLAQPLKDTPGAVTLLEREFIRMSGARDVVDLLRFVPGFQTSTAVDSDAPLATYHGRNDDWANRIQVLVDGRSVYSGLLQGSAGIGWKTLALDDIERIEVLRGSNSATYGARAFLGVVNIISRDVRDTLGAAVSLTRGENQVSDTGMRIGWTTGPATFRISADSASEDGLQGAFGKNHSERLNLSSLISINTGTELELRAGGVGLYAGRGPLDGDAGNPPRRWYIGSQFVQADLHHVLDESSDMSLSLSHTENTTRDRFPYLSLAPIGGINYFGATIDFGGNEYVDSMTAQYALRLNPSLRTVWGAEYRQERVVSPPLFDQLVGKSNQFYRLFASAEWRLSDALLLNAGVLLEHNDFSGDEVAPRLMLNWEVRPGHTLRAGASTAFRPPSAYEKFGRRRYYDANGQNPTFYFTFNDGSLQAERLFSKELGYNFSQPGSPFGADVRVFQEQIRDGILQTKDSPTEVYVNGHQDQINGLEWQLNWVPASATRVMLTQNWTTIESNTSVTGNSQFRTEHGAPRYTAAVTLMHRFQGGLQLSLMHQQADDFALMSIGSRKTVFSMQRTDLRLAQELRLGSQKAELAFVVQNLNDPYQDGDYQYRFNRRALLTLRIEH